MNQADLRLTNIKSWLKDELSINYDTFMPASEDASFRRYFRIQNEGDSQIIMDAPPDKESCSPFIDITQRLLNCHLNVPEILAKDLSQGFLLLSDLGEKQYLTVLSKENVETLYKNAINALVRMQLKADVVGLPLYDEGLLESEMLLFRDWLLNEHLQINLSSNEEGELSHCFSYLIHSALAQPKVFVHRDYHSRNLLFTEENNPGILDYQDAVNGPVTYDLVSLLKDCYIKWPEDKIEQWARYFYQTAEYLHPLLSEAGFLSAFHCMGVQRHLKASGIFARLYHRDGKNGYLKDVERTLSYIVDLKDRVDELNGLIELLERKVLPVLTEVNQQCMP